MKHLIWLIVAIVLIYGLWNMADPIKRRDIVPHMKQHGMRLGALIAAVLALLALAYHVPSLNIL